MRGGLVCPSHPQYIKETGKEAKKRLWGHRGTITQLGQENTQAPVGVHFRAPDHSYADLSFISIEKIRSRDIMVRKVRESYYIYTTSRNSTQWGQDWTQKHNANVKLEKNEFCCFKLYVYVLPTKSTFIELIEFMYLTILLTNSNPFNTPFPSPHPPIN